MRSCLLLLLTAGFLVGAAAANDGVEDDQETIQGTWQVVSAKDSGREAPQDAVMNLKWVINKETITHKFGGKTISWLYKLDATKKPKWIDLADGDRNTLGIYELKGDNLKVCLPEGRKGERTTAFESKPDSVNDILILLKREKP